MMTKHITLIKVRLFNMMVKETAEKKQIMAIYYIR